MAKMEMKKNKTREKALDEVADAIIGTCDTTRKYIEWLFDKYGIKITSDQLKDELLSRNIEICPGCGWWCESDELVDEDSNVVFCENCRSYI